MLKDEEPDRWKEILPETGKDYKMTETDPLAITSFIGGVLLVPAALLFGYLLETDNYPYDENLEIRVGFFLFFFILLIGPSAILAGLTSIIRICAGKDRMKSCGWALSGILLATASFLTAAWFVLINLSWMD